MSSLYFFFSLFILLLLVRRINPASLLPLCLPTFLVTSSNGVIYTDVLAPNTRRRDVSTMLNPNFGDYALRHSYGSRFHFYLSLLFFLKTRMCVPHRRSRKKVLRRSQLLGQTLTHFRLCNLH